MAGAWKGWRPIVVGGRRFRWRCDFHLPAEQYSASYAERGESWAPDELAVRPQDTPDRRLTVHWPACHGPLVTPRFVRTLIEDAARLGWPDAVPVVTVDGAG